MEELDGVPSRILGYNITTRTQITLSCLVTAILELLVYVVVITADICCAIQHFRDNNPIYGSFTVTFLCLPALATFCSIIVSPWQWPADECGEENGKFFGRQLFNFLFFPIGAMYRFLRRIFWSIEALLYDRETFERHHATFKAAETSPFELYHFLQAFLQAIPQIILQLFTLLREGVFRNYETSHVQVISILFSFIILAVVTATYQRFESQKIVGRIYPWMTPEQIQEMKFHMKQTKIDRSSEKKTPPSSYVELPQSEHIMRRFKSVNGDNGNQGADQRTSMPSFTKKSLHLGDYNLNVEESGSPNKNMQFTYNQNTNRDSNMSDNNLDSSRELTVNMDMRNPPTSIDFNIIEVDIRQSDNEDEEIISIRREDLHLDISPTEPAPPPPPITNLINRLSTWKEMLVLNAELYIKDHVPRLPPQLFEHEVKEQNKSSSPSTPTERFERVRSTVIVTDQSTTEQIDIETDFILPTRKKMVEGIEQDDFVAKATAFCGWIMFLIMRMLAISTFAIFYPMPCIYLCVAHYIFMVLCLIYETKFHEKIERIYFYFFLGYIYIFCLLEFKIKFKKPRRWYIGYVTLVLVQNLAMSIVWYAEADFHSWWFKYMFTIILLCLFYSILCLLVYYFILKPPDKILFENE